MKLALALIITLISLRGEASNSGASFSWTPQHAGTGEAITLSQPLVAFQQLDTPKAEPLLEIPGLPITHKTVEIESQYRAGTRLVVDEVKHEVVGLPGFRKDRYTFRAHLPECIKDCSLRFGFSRSKTIYNIDVSKISEHMYFPNQSSND